MNSLRRRAAAPLAALGLALWPGQAPAQPGGDLAGVSAWVGCYVTCTRATAPRGARLPPTPSLLAYPPLRSELQRLMGASALAEMVRSSGVESPVERRGDWIAAAACTPHDCGDRNFKLFVNLATREVLLCRTLREFVPGSQPAPDRGALYRSGSGRMAIPPAGCDRREGEESNWGVLQRLLAATGRP